MIDPNNPHNLIKCDPNCATCTTTPTTCTSCPSGTFLNSTTKKCIAGCSDKQKIVDGACVPCGATEKWNTVTKQCQEFTTGVTELYYIDPDHPD